MHTCTHIINEWKFPFHDFDKCFQIVCELRNFFYLMKYQMYGAKEKGEPLYALQNHKVSGILLFCIVFFGFEILIKEFLFEFYIICVRIVCANDEVHFSFPCAFMAIIIVVEMLEANRLCYFYILSFTCEITS